MAAANFAHFMNGPVVVTWNSVQLGFSEDGVQINIQPFFDQIPSDDFGGRAGPPSDSQILAAIATVDVALSKYDKAEVDKLTSYKAGGAVGVLPPIGSFIRQDGLSAALLLDGVLEDLTFATAYLRRNQEFNSGTKWRRYVIGWECWVNATDLGSLSSLQNRTLFTQATTTTPAPTTTTPAP